MGGGGGGGGFRDQRKKVIKLLGIREQKANEAGNTGTEALFLIF